MTNATKMPYFGLRNGVNHIQTFTGEGQLVAFVINMIILRLKRKADPAAV